MDRLIGRLFAAGLLACSASVSASTAVSSDTTTPTLAMQRLGVFATPLLPIGASPVSQENRALLSAIERYRAFGDATHLAPIDQFLKTYPESPWRTALLANEGLAYAHAGMFSAAIDKLQTVWQMRSNLPLNTSAERALMEKVYGKLLWLHTVLGHDQSVKTLLAEGKGMVLSGEAQAQETQAEEGLWRMTHEPDHARICGLVALEQLMKERGDQQGIDRIANDKAGPKGIDLAHLNALADRAGLASKVVQRQDNSPIPVPSVAHWKVGHYAAIVGKSGHRYHIKDAALGRDYWMTQAAIDAESSGYFLVPEATLAKHAYAWPIVANATAAQIYGAGITPGNNPDDTSSDDPDVNDACPFPGMPQYSVKAMLVSLSMHDTPVSYTPPKGPAVPVTFVYSQREANQPANFTFGNLGQKWLSNWTSYVQDDPNAPGSNVTIALRGDGTRHYAGYNAATGGIFPGRANRCASGRNVQQSRDLRTSAARWQHGSLWLIGWQHLFPAQNLSDQGCRSNG